MQESLRRALSERVFVSLTFNWSDCVALLATIVDNALLVGTLRLQWIEPCHPEWQEFEDIDEGLVFLQQRLRIETESSVVGENYIEHSTNMVGLRVDHLGQVKPPRVNDVVVIAQLTRLHAEIVRSDEYSTDMRLWKTRSRLEGLIERLYHNHVGLGSFRPSFILPPRA